MRGRCSKCGKQKQLTKHSLIGKHKPPYQLICRKCHDIIHKMTGPVNGNRKYQKSTPKWKRKKY